MKLRNNKSGFTLLEIIIVIIIVGVLASLALPRFFKTVEFSKSAEALNSIGVVRQSLERCYLQKSGTYAGCDMTSIDVEDPGAAPGALFAYAVADQSATGYSLRATRVGDAASWVQVLQAAGGVTRSGAGKFAGIQ